MRVWIEDWATKYEPQLGGFRPFVENLMCHVIMGKKGKFHLSNDPGRAALHSLGARNLRDIGFNKERHEWFLRDHPARTERPAEVSLQRGEPVRRGPPSVRVAARQIPELPQGSLGARRKPRSRTPPSIEGSPRHGPGR